MTAPTRPKTVAIGQAVGSIAVIAALRAVIFVDENVEEVLIDESCINAEIRLVERFAGLIFLRLSKSDESDTNRKSPVVIEVISVRS
jgi:hypothetical protein